MFLIRVASCAAQLVLRFARRDPCAFTVVGGLAPSYLAPGRTSPCICRSYTSVWLRKLPFSAVRDFLNSGAVVGRAFPSVCCRSGVTQGVGAGPRTLRRPLSVCLGTASPTAPRPTGGGRRGTGDLLLPLRDARPTADGQKKWFPDPPTEVTRGSRKGGFLSRPLGEGGRLTAPATDGSHSVSLRLALSKSVTAFTFRATTLSGRSSARDRRNVHAL